ncbi:Patatin-like phospholipase domain-containing protein 7 [Geodia barretti]|uniref:lysophospholipase n=1 Tax=Geodia barretti TaxID=519541 RepID=A0AA35TWU6_GEOBA|nr:Patatin-like phospholipase domain-containing protein 7 [Geodia barretti]
MAGTWEALGDQLEALNQYLQERPLAVLCSVFAVIVSSWLLWRCLSRYGSKKKPLAISTSLSSASSVSREGGTEEEEEEDRDKFDLIHRKREMVQNYGKKMFRKASSEFRHFRRKPREKISSIARRLLNKPEPTETQLHREPPDAFLDPDSEAGDSNIPSEVLYLLKSVRAFGHFEKPLFMELCKHVETKFVPSGAILFRPGQTDDSIYVVRNGRLRVYIVERDGTELPLKDAGPGDSVHSMLSILNAIIGSTRTFKSVAAKATRDSYVLQVKATAFRQFFENNPDSLLRMVQITMLRLQRVTFLALNEFLGLGHELINQKPALRGEFSVLRLKQSRLTRMSEADTFSSDRYPPPPPPPHSQDLQDSDSDNGTPGESTATTSSKGRHKTDGTRKHLRSSDEKHVRDDESTSEHSGGNSSHAKRKTLSLKTNESDSNSNVAISDDSTGQAANGAVSPTAHRKTVAIDMSQNECFTHRLLPAVSLEFDNVMDQARVNRQQFSAEGVTSFPSEPPKGRHFSTQTSIPLRYSHFASLDNSDVLQAATDDLVRIFQLKDESLLKGRIQLIEVGVNSVLGLEGDQECCVYFIASGRLKVYHLTGDQSKSQDLLYVATPGEFCGVLSALTGEPSFITVMAAVHSYLIAITKSNLYQIMSEQPKAVCGLAYDCVQRLSPLVRQIDFALDWTELEAGRALYRQEDEATAAYIILSGRLRSVVKRDDGKKELVDEFGRGEAIGVIEVMTSSKCATTVHAIRDSELACLPAGLLDTIKLKQPQVVSRLIHMLGERILGSYNRLSHYSTTNIASSKETKKHMASNLATVAVVPMTPDVPLSMFSAVLCSAVNSIAPALRLTSHYIQQELGSTALESVSEYRLRTWLGHQEDNNRIVIYEADPTLTQWTARCIRQADCILLVGLAEKGPTEGKIIRQVEKISIRVQKELVLLHGQGVDHPTGTMKWLNALGWLSSYFHVRCPDYFFIKKLQEDKKNAIPPPPNKHSDFARLARRLTGTSVGVVLGGGGARGLAHVGALQAFTEAGVPIDMVGGTSIGSLVGGLYCEERDSARVETRAREFAKRMARFGDKILDLTYPHSAMFSGRAFNRLMKDTFKEKQIEDLWIPYFCITTDITESKMRVHNAGSLWRYIRASMSLSGYMPPLCDPVDGHLLLDGGYVNNLPADVLTGQGAETVIAIDVGSEDNNELTNYGDYVSGWYCLWNKINPLAKKIRIPNLTEIQSRLAYVSCMRQLEAVKADGSCEYIRPPIDK